MMNGSNNPNGNTTRKTTANPTTRQNVGNIPTISMDSGSGAEFAAGKKVQQERVSMMTGKAAPDSRGRVVADISQLVPENKETPGVDIKESPQAEIFKPGGPFDTYVSDKKKEYFERMALEDAKAEVEGQVAEANESGEKFDDEEAEILMDQRDVAGKDTIAKVNGVSREDDVEETSSVSKAPAETENKSEVPFYTGTGYQDDYNYPNQINEDDFPRDESEGESSEDDDHHFPYDEDSESDEISGEEAGVGLTPNDVSAPVEEDNIRSGNVAFVGSTKIKITTDEETLDDLEKELSASDEDDGPSDDERLEELKAEITRKIKPKAKALNLAGFTIANKATVSNKILEIHDAAAGKWVLPTTGICIQMREFSGQKIEYIRENSANNPTAAKNRLKAIYDHIVSQKPQSFEAWCKSIAFADYDHLFMPMYLAAFSDSNYMPQTCVKEKGKIVGRETGCGKMFLSDNIPIMKCVKFKNDESKKKFWDLYDSDRSNSEGLYVSEVIPVSDKFAIEFCEPTIYSVLFEGGSYGREFSEKYENVIAFMPYISKIYWIDAARKKLVPVDYQKYDNNATKTAKSKVIRYARVLDTLNTDEYTNVVSIINSINDKNDWFSYRIPEMTCPECGRVIPEEETTAQSLVFTRHRLGILVNTSIN